MDHRRDPRFKSVTGEEHLRSGSRAGGSFRSISAWLTR